MDDRHVGHSDHAAGYGEGPCSVYRLEDSCAMLPAEGDVMRFDSALILGSTCLLGVIGCSSKTARPTFDGVETGGGDGTARDDSGGGKDTTIGKTGKGGNSPGVIGVDTPKGSADGDKAVPDDDPSNPNLTHPTCALGTCKDFPAEPLAGEDVPENAAELFGDADNMSGSLCVVEPQLGSGDKPGTMIPANWVRPRIRIQPSGGVDLFEIRLHSAAEANDLVAYTKQTSWYLPKHIWNGNPTTAGERAAGSGLANNGAGRPVEVTVRGINSKSPGKPVGTKGTFEIAPVVATGSMVFWTVSSMLVTKDSSKLLGFAVGDEGVAETLTLKDVAWTGQIGEDGAVLRGHYDDPATKPTGFSDGQVRCIGCHVSTPDTDSEAAVVFGDDWPWAKSAAMVNGTAKGKVPSWVSAGGRGVMKMPWWGTQSISKAHWGAKERIIVTSYGATFSSGTTRSDPWAKLPTYASENPSAGDDKIKWHKLAWINAANSATIDDVIHSPGTAKSASSGASGGDYGSALDTRQKQAAAAKGTGYGIIETGDTGVSATLPTMSHDGNKIAYTTTDYSPDGHPDYTAKTADIRIVDYNDGKGGKSTALEGASDANRLEYYPAYSPDDKFIAFTNAPAKSTKSPDGPYCNRFGEIHVIPATGGTSVKLAANDPVECVGDDPAEGAINSWPKWAPDAVAAHGKTYYFVIFSSARKYGDEFASQFNLDKNPLSTYAGLPKSSQLYLAAVVVDETGKLTSYPALHIWNQNRLADNGKAKATKLSNLTPDWAAFALPDLQIEDVPADIR